MTPIERKARELLAAEYERDEMSGVSDLIKSRADDLSTFERRAIRALITALTPPAGGLPELPESEFEASYGAGEKFYTASQLRAYGQACAASGVPEGWVLVPVEPTQEVVSAGYEAMLTDNVRNASEQGRIKRIYAAMLAAAPKLDAQGGGSQVALNRGGESD